MVGQVSVLFRRQINASQPMKLRVAVGGDINSLAILAEPGSSVRNLFCSTLRGDQRPLSRDQVQQPEITFIGGDVFTDQQFAIVGEKIEGAPAATLHLRQHPVGFRIRGIHHPQINVLSIAPGRAINKLVARVRPETARVSGFAVGQQRDRAGGKIITILLEILVAAGVLAENEIVAPGRLVSGTPRAVLEKSQLRPRATRKFNQVNLVGVGKACDDKHLAFGGMPARHSGKAKLGIAADFVRQPGWDRGDAFRHKIVTGNKIIVRGGKD